MTKGEWHYCGGTKKDGSCCEAKVPNDKGRDAKCHNHSTQTQKAGTGCGAASSSRSSPRRSSSRAGSDGKFCEGIKKDGQRCGNHAYGRGKYCRIHGNRRSSRGKSQERARSPSPKRAQSPARSGRRLSTVYTTMVPGQGIVVSGTPGSSASYNRTAYTAPRVVIPPPAPGAVFQSRAPAPMRYVAPQTQARPQTAPIAVQRPVPTLVPKQVTPPARAASPVRTPVPSPSVAHVSPVRPVSPSRQSVAQASPGGTFRSPSGRAMSPGGRHISPSGRHY
jgi:hypothetical protein